LKADASVVVVTNCGDYKETARAIGKIDYVENRVLRYGVSENAAFCRSFLLICAGTKGVWIPFCI